MKYHISYLFNYNGFRKEIESLFPVIEQGDLLSLYSRAKAVTEEFNPENYVLNSHLALSHALFPIARAENPKLRSSTIGRWLMIILSSYLETLPKYIGDSWMVLHGAFQKRGWSESKCDLFFEGQPIGLLINSSSSEQHQIPQNESPYWQWVRLPDTFNQGGWLSKEDCEDFLLELERNEEQILTAYSGNLNSNTEKQINSLNTMLFEAYNMALFCFREAVVAGRGIYMIKSWSDKDEDEMDYS